MSAPGFAARQAAALLLTGVLEQKRTLSEQVAASGGPLRTLASSERARAQAMAVGTLRHLGRIDAVLEQFLTRSPPRPARTALRLAVAEMHLDAVPAHAAVDGAVRLVRQAPKGRHLAGLVNAVARRVAAGGDTLWAGASETPMPGWLALPVREAYGRTVLEAIAAVHRRDRPPLDLTLRDPGTAERWAVALGAEALPTGSLRCAGRGRVSGLPGYDAGAWWVQDAAAALPVRLLGDVRGLSVLDLCAAPGGKTLQLAAAGAEVTALDISDRRLCRLRDNLDRTGLAARVEVGDALQWQPQTAFDAVLVDAPCSATGTLRRHPDLIHVRTGSDIAALVALQAELLARAWQWVRPGGRMVFCTCSLLPSEGEEQVAAFLGRTGDAQPLRTDASALGLEADWIDAGGQLRLRPDYWSERGGMDGFYATVLEKRREAA